MAPRKAKDATSSLDALKNYDYQRTSIVDRDGKTRHSASNGDALAKAMLIYAAAGGDLGKLVKANGLQDKIKVEQWDNVGLLRMAIGNSLRALIRNGTPVTVGDIEVKSLEQNVKMPESVAKDKKPRAKKAA